MFNNKVCYMILLLLMSSSTLYAVAQEDDLLTYENSSYGIKMLYPKDWHRTDFNPGDNGTIVEIVTGTSRPFCECICLSFLRELPAAQPS